MTIYLHKAAAELGYDNTFTIEENGEMWHGTDADRIYLTANQKKAVETKALEIENAKIAARQNVLTKLGLTADEVAALLG